MSPVDSVDLSGYFRRIGQPPPTAPTRTALDTILAGHLRWIPFENLDPLTGVAVTRLDPEALGDKLIRRRRGGFCFEQNGLLAAVLRRLGYRAEALAGRVVWGRDPLPGYAGLPPQTHQLLRVQIPEETGSLLVDAGFGGHTPPASLTEDYSGEPQPTFHGTYRLRREPMGPGELAVLELRSRDRWLPLYYFDETAKPAADARMGAWFASTSPEHRFTNVLVAATVDGDTRWNLEDSRLVARAPDGTGTEHRLTSVDAVLATLTDRFGLDIGDLDTLPEVVAARLAVA